MGGFSNLSSYQRNKGGSQFELINPSQAEDADSSRAPGLTSGLQGSVKVHRGALLLVPQ